MIPSNAKKIEVEGATIPFFKYENIYYIDSSLCVPPEPMVNALIGLNLLDEKSKLIMINHKPPMGLFPKIDSFFNFKIEDLSDGRVKIEFSKKANNALNLNFDTDCQG